MVSPDFSVKKVELPKTGDENKYNPNAAVHHSLKSSKDFKKVMGRGSKESKEELEAGKKKSPVQAFHDEGEAAEDELFVQSKDDQEKGAEAALSLFDLSKKTAQPKKILKETKGSSQVAHVQSPSDLFKTAAHKEIKEPPIDHKVPLKGNSVDDQENLASKKEQDQPDTSYVNPFLPILQAQTVVPSSGVGIKPAGTISPIMSELIEQIVKQMYTITDQDKTDTVMTLQYPPLFKDARIVISSFETARGQFNITFENLSQAGQRILDLEENRRSLLNALENKGYNIQILVTTTILEPRLNVDQTFAQQQKRDDRDQSGEGEGRKRRDEEGT